MEFCPHGYVKNHETLECDFVDALLFDLTLSTWPESFKYINAQDHLVMRGRTDAYSSDDAYLGRSLNNIGYFYFDGIDDHMTIEGEESNQLFLHHTMTISIWFKQVDQLNEI
jgi:hypothetical protein